MIAVEIVREALGPLVRYREVGGRIAVLTHCLYPSNAAVTVFITGGRNLAVVSDGGGAIEELTTLNREVPDPDRFLTRFCRPVGLHASEGAICSPEVQPDQLISAVLHVANASNTAARVGLEQFKLRKRLNLQEELDRVLLGKFSKRQIQRKRRLEGKSSRTYHFHRVVTLGGDRLLVIDAVSPDPNSINAHAIAHLDLRQLHDEFIFQRIVFDEEEHWRAADLNLLQMAAAIVPFTNLSVSLNRLDDAAP